MTVNDIIIYIMIFFSLVGAFDWIIGRRFGLGEKFEEGIAILFNGFDANVLPGFFVESVSGSIVVSCPSEVSIMTLSPGRTASIVS